ncbi:MULTISPECIES: iron chaperone [unclassified Agromyces]|uniref:iron chaperone n=1 Tax=unclassified Agromyces TaxID=2639701 RepID=UPI0030149986
MAEAKKAARDEDVEGFTDAERAAMKERAREVRGKKKKKDGTADVLEKIAEMGDADRAMAERLHALITEAAPELAPKTWYGMPAYAKDGKVLCFFQAASKFDSRYATFGFNDTAMLDDGEMWPTTFALTELTPRAEATIVELVTRAARG